MDDFVSRLRELGRDVEAAAGPLQLRPGAVRRIRRRQVRTVSLTALAAMGLAVGVFAGWQAVTSGAKTAGMTVRPAASASPTVITSIEIPETGVGVQTWTVTALVDEEGPKISLTGSPEPDSTVLNLPIDGKLWAREFWNGPSLDHWGIVGVVPSEGARVVIAFDNGRTVEAELFPLPPDLGSFKLFAAEASGELSDHEIRVENQEGDLITSEHRPKPDLRTP